MAIRVNGKFYENKTSRFLYPILNTFSNEFKEKYNLLKKSAMGIDDYYTSTKYKNIDSKVFILVERQIRNKNFEVFRDYIKSDSCYIDDYQFDTDLKKPKYHMFVIKLPKAFDKTYECFLKAEYSKMYSNHYINKFFKNSPEYHILKKTKEGIEYFKKVMMKQFGVIPEFITECELPLVNNEEIFNYEGNQTFYKYERI